MCLKCFQIYSIRLTVRSFIKKLTIAVSIVQKKGVVWHKVGVVVKISRALRAQLDIAPTQLQPSTSSYTYVFSNYFLLISYLCNWVELFLTI